MMYSGYCAHCGYTGTFQWVRGKLVHTPETGKCGKEYKS